MIAAGGSASFRAVRSGSAAKLDGLVRGDGVLDARMPHARILAGAALLYLALRLPWLGSIPGYTFDEGLLGLVAKNWVTLGDPFFGGNLDLLRFPLFTSLLAGLYALCGCSIMVSRTLSIAAGLASFWLLARIARRLLPCAAVPWALLLYAADFVLVRYQRYGLAESLQIFLLLGVVLVWTNRPRKQASWKHALWKGSFLALAVLQKPTSLHLLPALIWLDIHRDSGDILYRTASTEENAESAAAVPATGGKARLGRSAWLPYVVAASICAAAYAALWMAFGDLFLNAWRLYARPSFPLTDLPRTLGLLALGSPFAFVSLALFPMWAWAKRRRPPRNDSPAEDDSPPGRMSRGQDPQSGFLAVWILGGLLFLLAQPLHPVRYFAALWPAAILAAAWLLHEAACRLRPIWSRREVARTVRGSALPAIAVAYGVLAFVGYYLIGGHRDSTGRDVAAWMKAHASLDARVLGAPHLGVDIPQPFLEVTGVRALALSDSVLTVHDARFILYDPEWRAISDRLKLGVEDTLRATSVLRAKVGEAEIWERK